MNTVVTSVNKGVAGVMSFVRATLLVLITAALTIFTIQNLTPFEIRFIVWSVQAPGAVVVIALFILGAAFGFLASALRPGKTDTVNSSTAWGHRL